jgi:hypothetical protein
MSRVRAFFLASAAVLVGACSDSSNSPTTGPAEPDPAVLQQSATAVMLKGYWSDGKAFDLMHSPLLCNFGGTGPECLRVFHSGTYVERVFHRGRAQGTGCSRSVIRIAGIVRGRSGFRCHRRGDILTFTWLIGERHPLGTRIQVDYTGAGAASPTGFVYTNYR